MKLRNKRILITAGPTWVPIDKVRVISNIATGETGILLAEKFKRLGAQVTLVLGPVEFCCLNKKIKLIRFRFFDELLGIIKRELKSKKYDIIIHSAAVADFRPARLAKGKINSDRAYSLKLLPLPKIINNIRASNPEAALVMFKLESGVSDAALIRKARKAQLKIGADLVVANKISPYHAYIIDKTADTLSVKNKIDLTNKLTKLLVTEQ